MSKKMVNIVKIKCPHCLLEIPHKLKGRAGARIVYCDHPDYDTCGERFAISYYAKMKITVDVEVAQVNWCKASGGASEVSA